MSERAPSDGYISAGMQKIHYHDWPGGERVILFIHGLTASSRVWDALIEELGPKYRAIAVDLRGRGLSDKPPSGNYGYVTHAQDMTQLIRTLGLGKVIVVGLSMGTCVGVILAALYPELVSHLILVDGGAVGPELTEEALLEQVMSRLAIEYPSLKDYIAYRKREATCVKPWTEHWEKSLIYDVEIKDNGSVVSRSSSEAINEDIHYMSIYKAEKYAPDIKAPTLVFWAPEALIEGAGPFFAGDTLRGLVKLLNKGRLIRINGANHYTIMINPDYVTQMAREIDVFLVEPK